MSTVAELVDKVCTMYSRQDLSDRLIANFKSALYNAHKIDKFSRDKAVVNIADPVILNSAIALGRTLNLPDLREIRKVQLYSAYTLAGSTVVPTTSSEIILPDPGYQNLGDLINDKNYYGMRYTMLYSIVGDTINFTGVDSTTRVLQITGLFLPTFTLNELTDAWESNSWILRDEPQVVEAYLRKYVAQILDDDKKLRNANDEIMQVKRDLIASYSVELL